MVDRWRSEAGSSNKSGRIYWSNVCKSIVLSMAARVAFATTASVTLSAVTITGRPVTHPDAETLGGDQAAAAQGTPCLLCFNSVFASVWHAHVLTKSCDYAQLRLPRSCWPWSVGLVRLSSCTVSLPTYAPRNHDTKYYAARTSTTGIARLWNASMRYSSPWVYPWPATALLACNYRSCLAPMYAHSAMSVHGTTFSYCRLDCDVQKALLAVQLDDDKCDTSTRVSDVICHTQFAKTYAIATTFVPYK